MENEECCGGNCGCHEEKMEKHCECGGDCDCDDLSTEDLAESNNIILSALIEVLIKKNVIAQDELDQMIEEISSEDDEEDDSSETQESMAPQ